MVIGRFYSLLRSSVWLTSVVVLLAYSLLTVLMTWPVVAQLNTHLIGDGDDMWVHYWDGWWVKQALQQGRDVFHTPLLFHPTGVSLLFHNFAWVNIALWLLLEPSVGGITAYNLVHVLHIPLCGLGMFLLARRLTRSNTIAFASGLIFAFWPYRMADVNHPSLVSTELLPVLMLVILRLFEDGKPIREGVISGILLALIGYMRWQLLILAGFMMVLYLLYVLVWERRLWSWKVVAGLALAGVVMGALTAPLLFPPVQELMKNGIPDAMYSLTGLRQDILAWLIPQHQHPLAALFDKVFPRYGSSKLHRRHSAFVGYVATGLTAVGVITGRKRRRIWLWLVMAVLCFIFALGLCVQFDLVCYTNIPLPYRLVAWSPPAKMLGHPHRLNALLALPVAILAGFGASATREWLSRRRWWDKLPVRSSAFVTLLTLLILADYCSIPTSMVRPRIPAFYATLADQADDFAIVEVPGTREHTEYYMFYQTVHGHPMMGGHVSRLPPGALEFTSTIPLVRGIYERGSLRTKPPDVSRQLSLLAEAGFRYIIVQKRFAKPEQLAKWGSYLVISPYYEDDEVVVYSTTPVAGRDFSLEHELGAGVGLIEADLSVEGARPGDELVIDVTWGTTAPPGADLQAEVVLVNEEGEVGQAQRFDIFPSWPTGDWPANAIVRDRYVLMFDVWVDGGRHSVILRLLQDGQPVGQEVQMGEVEIQLPARSFAVPPMSQEVGAAFGDDLRLLGYDLKAETDALHITLHWQALRRMDTNYTMFVHVLDATSGEIVGQVDVMPYGFTYFTAWWEEEEVVSDQIVVPLEGIPSGTYSLAVGVYDADTGERAAISGQTSDSVSADGRLILPDEVTR
jgi:hypothetical protein